MNNKLINIFCAKCQEDTSHKASVDGNGEFLFECQNLVNDVKCDRFLKLSADHPGESFKEYFTKHKESNQGQISKEEQEKTLAAVMEKLNVAKTEAPAE